MFNDTRAPGALQRACKIRLIGEQRLHSAVSPCHSLRFARWQVWRRSKLRRLTHACSFRFGGNESCKSQSRGRRVPHSIPLVLLALVSLARRLVCVLLSRPRNVTMLQRSSIGVHSRFLNVLFFLFVSLLAGHAHAALT